MLTMYYQAFISVNTIIIIIIIIIIILLSNKKKFFFDIVLICPRGNTGENLPQNELKENRRNTESVAKWNRGNHKGSESCER